MPLTTPQEPIWNVIHLQLIAQLGLIVSANDGGYWNTVKKVYGFRPAEFDTAKLPAIAVYPVPESSKRVYQDGSRTVTDHVQYFMDLEMKDDGSDPPQIGQNRLLADVHRAIYTIPNLGIPGVRRVKFPVGPKFENGYVRGESKYLSFRYLLEVVMAFQDDRP